MKAASIFGLPGRVIRRLCFLLRREDDRRNDRSIFSFVIFSKDRCLQLDGLIRSLHFFASGNYSVVVLYKASTPEHAQAYRQLIALQPAVRFEEQGRDFKVSLVTLLSSLPDSRIFFLVDDIVFKEPLDLAVLESIDSRETVVSLRLAPHLQYSYSLKQDQPLPQLRKSDGGLLYWQWDKGAADWAYPLSVDGHLFLLSDAEYWSKNLDYQAPNSFESSLQLFRQRFLRLQGACFARAVIFNNPCNLVQTELDNPHGGKNASDFLQLWQQGRRMDFQAFAGLVNRSVHEETEIPLT